MKIIDYFSGLMGTNNGNQEDDFTDPDGNVLSQGSSANEEQIFNYGKACTLNFNSISLKTISIGLWYTKVTEFENHDHHLHKFPLKTF